MAVTRITSFRLPESTLHELRELAHHMPRGSQAKVLRELIAVAHKRLQRRKDYVRILPPVGTSDDSR